MDYERAAEQSRSPYLRLLARTLVDETGQVATICACLIWRDRRKRMRDRPDWLPWVEAVASVDQDAAAQVAQLYRGVHIYEAESMRPGQWRLRKGPRAAVGMLSTIEGCMVGDARLVLFGAHESLSTLPAPKRIAAVLRAEKMVRELEKSAA